MVQQTIADSAHELSNTIKQAFGLVLNPPGGGMKVTALQMAREHELGIVPYMLRTWPLRFCFFYLLCTGRCKVATTYVVCMLASIVRPFRGVRC